MSDNTVAPDFFDPTCQNDDVLRCVLHFLRTLTAHYVRTIIRTDAESKAVGVLLIAKGISIREGAECYPTSGAPFDSVSLRLTVSGLRWQKVLQDNEKIDALKARGAVLSFVWSAYQDNKESFEREHLQGPCAQAGAQSVAGAKAETGPITINVPPPVVNVQLPAAATAPAAPAAEVKVVDQWEGLRRLDLPKTYKWENVTFVIIDDETFKVLAGAAKHRLKIYDVGLRDKRKRSGGVRNWELLTRLADDPHLLPGHGKRVTKKQVSELREWLMGFTGIQTDPFQTYAKGIGWCPHFKAMRSSYADAE